VIVIICLLLLLLLWRFLAHVEMQKSLQWWSEKLTTQLWYGSEQIRDGLLQDVFAIRRSLELSLVNHQEISVATSQDWLGQLDQLHQALGALRNVLAPAYVEESLPLAIQSLLQQWKLRLETKLPADWPAEPLLRSRVILMTISELLKIVIPEKLPVEEVGWHTCALDTPSQCPYDAKEPGIDIHLVIQLKQRQQFAELSVVINHSDHFPLLSPARRRELRYLKQSFQCLTSGQCSYRCTGSTIAFYLCWKLVEQNRKEF
jgi:hypothetical protein